MVNIILYKCTQQTIIIAFIIHTHCSRHSDIAITYNVGVKIENHFRNEYFKVVAVIEC